MSRGTGKIACALFALILAWSAWDPAIAIGDPAGGTPAPGRRITRPQRSPIPLPPNLQSGAAATLDFAISLPAGVGTGSPSGTSGVAPPPSPLAPVPIPGSSFPGLADDLRVIPPDTMGAVGPAHLVSFLNSDVGFFTKAGALLNPGTTLRDFWLPLIISNGLPDNALRPTVFDPKVLYDQHDNTFVAMTLIGRPPDKSWVLLARSNTSNPMQGWSQWALEGSNDNTLWADYPGLGLDNANIYITTNLFDAADDFHYIKVWIIPKATLPPSGQVLANAIELANPFNWNQLNTGPFSFQPTHVFGTPGAAYIVGEDHLFTGVSRALRIARVWPPFLDLGTVPVTFYSSQLPLAPFLQIDTGDSRILNVVYRNGSLFATHTVPNPGLTRTVARWYEINPVTMNRLQEGTVSDANRFYYYPSLAVNSAGDVAIGFSGSSQNPPEYAGAYYTVRRATDPAGTMHPVTLLRSGEASYFKTFSSTVNRWGDFSATVVDPVDDTSFWTLQQIASTPVVTQTHGILDTWATWWGSFGAPAIAPPADLAVTQPSPTQFRLTWTNPEPGTDNITVERRTAPAGNFADLGVLLPTTAEEYTDTFSPNPGTTYFYRVRVGNAGGSSYSNEAFATQSGPAPPPQVLSGGGGGGCLSAAGSMSAGDPATDAASIVLLLSPLVVIPSRRLLRRLRRKNTLRHPVC